MKNSPIFASHQFLCGPEGRGSVPLNESAFVANAVESQNKDEERELVEQMNDVVVYRMVFTTVRMNIVYDYIQGLREKISITLAELLVNDGLGEKEFNFVFSHNPLSLRAFLLEVTQVWHLV